MTLLGLATIWRGAVGAATFHYHAAPTTLALGAGLSLLAAGVAMALVQRGQARRAPASLLAGGMEYELPRGTGRWGLVVGIAFLLGAVALLTMAGHGQDQQAAETFFSAGACLLLAGIGFCQSLLASIASFPDHAGSGDWACNFPRKSDDVGRMTSRGGILRRVLVKLSIMQSQRFALTLAALGRRNAARQRRRSLTTISVLASGVFLLVAVSAFQQDPGHAAHQRSSGTGGFALYAQATLPIYDDLNSPAGRAVFGLSATELCDVHIVPLRLREGDDASCLNLNRAQQPRLFGVSPDELEQRQAFSFAQTQTSGGLGPACPTQNKVGRDGSSLRWLLLNQPQPDGTVPAIGDEQTVVWGLGKKLGDTLPYTDDSGHTFTLRIVGVLANSILQGSLLISEEHFVELFPLSGGYRAFLMDAPSARAAEVAATLSRALQDRGLEVVPAWQRLAQFMAVENTYLGIFQVLGGLGLLLGSVGLGLVVLRNVLERRSELALLLALGFRRRDVQQMVLSEHWLLIVLGLVIGLLSAVLAIWPTWTTAGTAVPVPLLAGTLGGLALGGLLWTWLAARAALRGPLLAALRNE